MFAVIITNKSISMESEHQTVLITLVIIWITGSPTEIGQKISSVCFPHIVALIQSLAINPCIAIGKKMREVKRKCVDVLIIQNG